MSINDTQSQLYIARDIEISLLLLKLQRCDEAIEQIEIAVTNHRKTFQTQGRIIFSKVLYLPCQKTM
jgi:hypothetical protein